MSEYLGAAVEEIFGSMEERFIPEGAVGVRTVIGYSISGEGGGAWKVIIDDGKLAKEKISREPENCNVLIAADAETFVGVTVGAISQADAFSSGKISVKGDTSILSAILPKVFIPFRPVKESKDVNEELICLNSVISLMQRFSTGPVMGRWFRGLKEKKFMANRCPQCGRTQVPPREICAACRVRCDEFVEVGPEATVTAIDKVFYSSPDPLTGKARETPYAAFFMVLDGSTPGESFCHEIKREDFSRLEKGSRVRPVWSEKRTGSYRDLLYFEIID